MNPLYIKFLDLKKMKQKIYSIKFFHNRFKNMYFINFLTFKMICNTFLKMKTRKR